MVTGSELRMLAWVVYVGRLQATEAVVVVTGRMGGCWMREVPDDGIEAECPKCGLRAVVAEQETMIDLPSKCEQDQGYECPHIREAISTAHSKVRSASSPS